MKLGIKLIMISLGVVCLFQTSQAQIQQGSFGYYNDALRYSQLQNPGTARFSALAGSGSVLGGDISSAIYNPAGLGVYNRSQFVFTPGFSSLQTEGNSFGTANKDEATKLSIANLGVVINFNKGDLIPGSFRGGSLAITYNRINDFNRNVLSSGYNGSNSIIDNMLQQADGLFPEELSGIAQTGYDHYLINPDPNGAGMGITTSSYTNSRIYTESFNNEPLSSFTIDERLELNGTGVNFNIGAIVRPLDVLRVGLSYTSPTYYSFNEEGDNIYNSEWNNYDVSNFRDDMGNRLILEDTVLGSLQTATDIFVSSFNLKTPAKLNAGLAFFFNKNGFITADIEHLNYANANVSSSDFFTGSDNTTIENIYNSATNIKLGGEYRYEMFRLRAGYAHYGDPYKSNFDGVDLDRSRKMISGGVGINLGKYFFDLAIVNTKFDQSFRSYRMAVLEDSPLTVIKHNMTNAKLTFGLNF